MSKEQFPLIKRCFPELEILRTDGTWRFIINAEDLEALLAKGVRVYLNEYGVICQSQMNPVDFNRTALLIGIEPIQKDTAESLLRELIKVRYDHEAMKHTGSGALHRLKDIEDRARKLLESKL